MFLILIFVRLSSGLSVCLAGGLVSFVSSYLQPPVFLPPSLQPSVSLHPSGSAVYLQNLFPVILMDLSNYVTLSSLFFF